MNYVMMTTMLTTMHSISTILSSIVADLIHLNAMYDEDCGGDHLVLDGHFVDDLDHVDHGHDLNIYRDGDHEKVVSVDDDFHSMNEDCHLAHDYGWNSTATVEVHDDPDWLPSPDGCHSMALASQPRRPVLRRSEQ